METIQIVQNVAICWKTRLNLRVLFTSYNPFSEAQAAGQSAGNRDPIFGTRDPQRLHAMPLM